MSEKKKQIVVTCGQAFKGLLRDMNETFTAPSASKEALGMSEREATECILSCLQAGGFLDESLAPTESMKVEAKRTLALRAPSAKAGAGAALTKAQEEAEMLRKQLADALAALAAKQEEAEQAAKDAAAKLEAGLKPKAQRGK